MTEEIGGSLVFPFVSGGLQLLESTGINGFNLQDATPTILSWTSPNDGNLHRVTVFMSLYVSSAETGGQINIQYVVPSGQTNAASVTGGGSGAGAHTFTNYEIIIGPNTTVSLVQASALTAGAAVLWAEMWGS